MARNEEKQLARLNRYYLEKQKQEELKKRPPRPRLDTLNTSRDLRKWLPTITRDIDFYVKQMEVTCYTDSKIDEFKDRIERLRKEYHAYLHKLRKLEPEVSLTSWSDRPYTNRKRPGDTISQGSGEAENDNEEPKEKTQTLSDPLGKFVPIAAPVLHNMLNIVAMHGLEKPAPIVWNVNPETEDQPLQFCQEKTLAVCNHSISSSEDHPFQNSSSETLAICDQTCSPCCSEKDSDCSDDLRAPQLSKCDAHFCKNCCGRFKDERVIASSVCKDKHETESVVSLCSGKGDRLENDCQDETKSATGKSKVSMPVPDFCDGKVISEMTFGTKSGSVSVIKRATSKSLSSLNLLQLDYSDSSDENL